MSLTLSHMLQDAFSPLDNYVQKGDVESIANNASLRRNNTNVTIQLIVTIRCLPQFIKMFTVLQKTEKKVNTFKKTFERIDLIKLSNEDYRSLRILLERYKGFGHTFADLDKYRHDEFFIVRLFGIRLCKVRNSVLTILSNLDRDLTDTYTSNLKSKYFTPVSDLDRWRNRSSVSSYQM